MSDLLVHTLSDFASLILPCLDKVGARDISAIGCGSAEISERLAGRMEICGGAVTSITPPVERQGENGAGKPLNSRAQPPLDTLKPCEAADAWLIDGDPHYYAVFHQLIAIDALQRDAGKPLLVFLHDVSWPCARRDFYQSPAHVPPGWRHPHSFEHGVNLDTNDVIKERGLRGMGRFAVALQSGGPRNGVLTAVEDFLELTDREERQLRYVHVPAMLGLGIVFDAGVDWSGALAEFLLPYHANPLIARIEEHRLRHWLKAIELRDRSTDAA